MPYGEAPPRRRGRKCADLADRLSDFLEGDLDEGLPRVDQRESLAATAASNSSTLGRSSGPSPQNP